MVTMSDGVKLAVDVYRPIKGGGQPASGRFPVILSQTPYGKRSATTTQSMGPGFGGDGFYPYLVQRGYINVVADVRGTGSSDGDFQLFGPREMRDGVQLVRWAARLPGSSGPLGLAGSSYVGLNQIFTAALAGPRSPVPGSTCSSGLPACNGARVRCWKRSPRVRRAPAAVFTCTCWKPSISAAGPISIFPMGWSAISTISACCRSG